MTEILKQATVIPYLIAPQTTTHLIRKSSFRPDRRQPAGLARDLEDLAELEKFHYKSHSAQVYKWQGTGPTVFLAHGWSSRALRFKSLLQELVRLDFNIIALDGVGHGRSSGDYSSYPEYVDLITTFLGSIEKSPDILIGHSMGGSAVARAAFELKLDSSIALIAPMYSFAEEMKKFEKTLPIHPYVYNKMINKVVEENGRPAHAISLDSVCERFANQALFIHDTTDEVTLLADTEKAHQAWVNSELMITSGLGHSKILDDSKVIERILSFAKIN